MRFLSMSLPIILAVVLTVAALSQAGVYPMPPDGISAEKYDGFSGVLTIAIEKELSVEFPQLQRWINEITNLFEKSNKGVYLRCIDYTREKRDSVTQGPQPADIILCSAGSVSDGKWTSPGEFDLMPAFTSVEPTVAIAAGGYLLGFYGEPPQSLDVLPDGAVGCGVDHSAVWVALCERFSPVSTEKRTISTPDIGLEPVETPIPTLAPAAGTQIARRNLRTADIDTLFSEFLSGDILAMPLNENQVAKIRNGQQEGRYGDIRFLNSAGYTDRVVYAAIPASGRADGAERAAEAAEFIGMLLSDEAQARLAKRNMFPTAMVEGIYTGTPGMQLIEDALRRSDCVVQSASEPAIAVDFDAFLDGTIPAREIMRKLRNSR